MVLQDLIRAVDVLSSDELEALYLHIRQQREQRRLVQDGAQDGIIMPPIPLDVDILRQIGAALREGFSKADLEELDQAMNAEYIEPLDDDE